MPADAAGPLRPALPLATLALTARSAEGAPPVGSCLQQLWLTFFFDGTGNNMAADQGTLKHSNVARLFNVHVPDDSAKGIYRVYIPGVGTYFREVGDDGGSTLGLVMARMGDRRLDWALKRFDQLLKPHLARANSPANRITEVNVAVFGFSRGAALARAFINRLVAQRGTPAKQGWRLLAADAPLRIRFMGLLDTVASVGLTLSSNTTNAVAAYAGGGKAATFLRLAAPKFKDTWPTELAFAPQAQPGADPAPGYADGHQAWGGEQAIPHGVEEVRHFVAAHEVRNSFPVDSIWVANNGRIDVVGHFYERVYPGAHSDVGGGYRPGEGGKSLEPSEKLSQIPLHHMYEAAIERGVPLLPKTGWTQGNQQDFELSPILNEHFNYYTSKLPSSDILGNNMNASMRLYFAWRFASIRRKAGGDRSEAKRIEQADRQYSADAKVLDAEIARLETADREAMQEHNLALARSQAYVQSNYGNPNLDMAPYRAAIAKASARRAGTQHALLSAKAKRDALPDMSPLNDAIAMYDQQLLEDARAIHDVYSARGMFGGAPDAERRRELRPHYKALVEAYEDEYIHNRGLKDEKIIAFFEHYVHDSLSGFAKDATLPSDPRVIYLGGDEKYRYARNEPRHDGEEAQYASVEKDEAAQSA